jgi:hypothetical protein
MIVETFFLVVEKRSICTQNSQDLSGGPVAGPTFPKYLAAFMSLVAA